MFKQKKPQPARLYKIEPKSSIFERLSNTISKIGFYCKSLIRNPIFLFIIFTIVLFIFSFKVIGYNPSGYYNHI